MIDFDMNGLLIVAAYTALRFGVPILAFCVLCKAVPRLFPQQTS